ncbi:MAG: hypothetical protein ABI162_03650 [Luteolibacter sp.]
MNQEPEIPEPVPTIPRGPLWVALAVPSAVTVIANLAIGFLSGRENDLVILPLFLPLVVLFVIIVESFHFDRVVRQRYRERSLLFLNIAYFLGQIIVCLTLWAGSCALFPSFSIH